jgi:hypothetical protein
MKIIREYINEKFEEISDPIKDLEIGVIHLFKDFMKLFGEQDKYCYVYSINVRPTFMDFIFHTKVIAKLPDNDLSNLSEYVANIIGNLGFNSILTDPKLVIAYDKIWKKTLPQYIRFNLIPPARNKFELGNYRRSNTTTLKLYNGNHIPIEDKDYQIYLDKLINESFKENSDPIQDLGIGLTYWKEYWQKEAWIIGHSSFYDNSMNIFGEAGYDNEVMCVYSVLDDISSQITSMSDLNELYIKALKHAIKTYSRTFTGECDIKLIKKILQDKFHINIIKNIKESLNEEFKENSDPISDLGIGVEHDIKKRIERLKETGFYNFKIIYIRNNFYIEVQSQETYFNKINMVKDINNILTPYIVPRKRASRNSVNVNIDWFKILPQYVKAFENVISF